jgi:hypothetical protein
LKNVMYSVIPKLAKINSSSTKNMGLLNIYKGK